MSDYRLALDCPSALIPYMRIYLEIWVGLDRVKFFDYYILANTLHVISKDKRIILNCYFSRKARQFFVNCGFAGATARAVYKTRRLVGYERAKRSIEPIKELDGITVNTRLDDIEFWQYINWLKAEYARLYCAKSDEVVCLSINKIKSSVEFCNSDMIAKIHKITASVLINKGV